MKYNNLKEDKWFELQQPLLLWMANTNYGRDLLCIDKSFPLITKIAKNYIRASEGNQNISDFRTRSKWANVIRYRWKEFQEYSLYFKPIYVSNLFPVIPSWKFAYTTSTFYPDPDPETATVDGRAGIVNANNTWANTRTGTGNFATDSDSVETYILIRSNATSPNWDHNVPAFFLFDTSSIPDTDSISSSTLSLRGTAKLDDASITPNITIVAGNPASNTSLTGTDYATRGTTEFASRITYASWSTAGYNDFALNASGISNISKTGISKFCAMNGQYDFDNSAPTHPGSAQSSYLQGYYAEQTGTTDDPKLVVVHATATTVKDLIMMGIIPFAR